MALKSASADTKSRKLADDLGIFDHPTESNLKRSKSASKDNLKLYSASEDEHHSRLGEHAAALWKNNKMTDIGVKLRGIKYLAHKTVLSCYSKYFKDLLLESEPSMTIINLDLNAVSNEAFGALLCYMYTGKLNLNVQNIGEVYTASRKLGIPGALKLCTKILTGKRRHDVHCVYVYVTAQRLGLEDAAKRALRMMCKRFEQIVGTPEYLGLNHAQIMQYLGADTLATRSEVIVYLGALKWISVRYLEREPFAVDVIGCVRFPMMSLTEILACHSPPLLPGIVEMPEISRMLLQGTCYISAKAINEEKRFLRYACPERTYLLEREVIILWDPNIFDPERYALYAKEVAATTIQAGFRGLQVRKSLRKESQAANVIQKAFRRYFLTHLGPLESPYTDTSSDSESEMDSEPSLKDGSQPVSIPKRFSLAESMKNFLTPSFSLMPQKRQSLKPAEGNKDVDPETSEPSLSGITSGVRSSLGDLADRVNSFFHEKDGSHKTPAETEVSKFKNPNPKRESPPRAATANDPGTSRGPDGSLTSERSPLEDESNLESIGYIVVTGGFIANDVDDTRSGTMLFLYDPAKNTWKTLGNMPKPRHHHRAVYFKGSIYCIGGCDPRKTRKGRMVPLRTCYELDLRTMKWREIQKMRYCRMYHSVAELNGKIYVVSGQDEHNRILNSVEVYDPDSDTWSVLPDPLDTPVMGAGVCAYDGRLWLVGGMGQDREGRISVVGSVTCYDPQKGEFIHNISNLPHPRAFAEAVVYGNHVLVIGGTEYSDSDVYSDKLSSTVDIIYYEEGKKKWRSFPTLPSPRHFVGPIALGKFLFVVGGLTSHGTTALDDVLRFIEATGQWHHCASLPFPLCGFAAVPVPKDT